MIPPITSIRVSLTLLQHLLLKNISKVISGLPIIRWAVNEYVSVLTIETPSFWQPVSYNIVSKRGNRAQFKNMIDTCHAAGVEVIADAVINHMAGVDSGESLFDDSQSSLLNKIFAGVGVGGSSKPYGVRTDK